MRLTTCASGLTKRGAWLIVTLALIVVLALSACAGRGAGRQSGTGQSIQTAGDTTATVNDLAQTDTQLDAIVAALDSANLDASIDESGKDSPIQP